MSEMKLNSIDIENVRNILKKIVNDKSSIDVGEGFLFFSIKVNEKEKTTDIETIAGMNLNIFRTPNVLNSLDKNYQNFQLNTMEKMINEIKESNSF